jgi:hypothetical protein
MRHVEFLGDLERAFATSLYPLRVPIAIGIAGAIIALVVLARRRGWLRAAHRHPGRSTAVLALVLAAGLPIAWYLGSPLFIRTSLVEPAPSFAPPAPSHAPATAPITTPEPAVEPTPFPSRSGTFTGADDFHYGRGTAALIEAQPGTWVVRFDNFSVRNGPDLYVYLSPDPRGYTKGAVELGRLKATDGDFNTRVPAGTDVASLQSVVIWCKQFAVQFAVAPLD